MFKNHSSLNPETHKKFLKDWVKVTFHGLCFPSLLDMGPSQDWRSK